MLLINKKGGEFMKPYDPILTYITKHDMLEEMFSYAVYMWHMSGLSLYNSAVLVVQRPGLGFAANESTWQRDYGRLIKPEARPLIIVKPFSPLEIYYEASDTYSPEDKPLRSWMQQPKTFEIPTMPPFTKEDLVLVLNRHGVYFGERDLGERLCGEMIYQKTPMPIECHNKKGEPIKLFTHYAMILNSRHELPQQTATFFHEIGHLLCGHLPQDKEITDKDFLGCKIPKRGNIPPEQKEYEAELTCKIIMKAFKWDYTPDKNIAGVAKFESKDITPGILDVTLSAANRFLSWLADIYITAPMGKYTY